MTYDLRPLLMQEADDNGLTERQQAIITLRTIDWRKLDVMQNDAILYCIDLLNELEEETK